MVIPLLVSQRGSIISTRYIDSIVFIAALDVRYGDRHTKNLADIGFIGVAIKAAPSLFQAFLTTILSAISLLLTAPLSPLVAWIYAGALSLILFAAPAALVWAQRYKK